MRTYLSCRDWVVSSWMRSPKETTRWSPGINLFFGTVILLNNLFIDLLYPFVDPRVRYR